MDFANVIKSSNRADVFKENRGLVGTDKYQVGRLLHDHLVKKVWPQLACCLGSAPQTSATGFSAVPVRNLLDLQHLFEFSSVSSCTTMRILCGGGMQKWVLFGNYVNRGFEFRHKRVNVLINVTGKFYVFVENRYAEFTPGLGQYLDRS